MDITEFEVDYRHYAPMGGMAYVIVKGGVVIGASTSEAGAWELADMVALFGYFDPNEPAQRAALRARKAALNSARAQWFADTRASRASRASARPLAGGSRQQRLLAGARRR